MMMRVFKDWAIFVGVLLVTIVLASQALALGTGDVERVVGVIEALADDLGDLAYDEEAADDWYDEDSSYEGRIAAAGFTKKTWRHALDRTVKGYFASLSNAAFEAMFAPLFAFEDRADFSEAQNQAMHQLAAETRARLARWRAEGVRDASVVRPFAGRIERALMGQVED